MSTVPAMSTVRHAAIYVRVSTDRQVTSNQLPALLARAPDALVYEETGSAVKRRPVFDRLLADCRAGRVSTVYVWAIDRLGRSMAGVVALITELTSLGVSVVSVSEPWLDTSGPTRDLLVAIFGWAAQFERARLVERINAGLDRARRQGTRLGRPPAYAPEVLEQARQLVASGLSVRAAAAQAGMSATTLRSHLKT